MTTKANGGDGSNPEVSERATRRRFSAEYKLGILEEADRCALGEQGALLRREGLYSSHLVKWREQRSKGALAALSKKRGRKVERTPEQIEMERLRRENECLTRRLAQVEKIVEVQKKLSAMEQALAEENK